MTTTPDDVVTDDRPETVEETVKALLVENTGSHLCDSGGAYGRHWEDNQQDPPWERPRYEVNRDYVVMNLYYWLTEEAGLERDEFVVDREREFDAFADGELADAAWLTCMEQWGQRQAGSQRGMVGGRSLACWTANSYNKTNPLSQTIQFCHWHECADQEWVLIQVHQGCDVRGGYTKPRLFRVADHGRFHVPRELDFWCPDCGDGFRETEIELPEAERRYDADANVVRCPDCSEPMSIAVR